MILDAMLRFSNAQALTATARSTNTLDLGVSRKLFSGVSFSALIIPTVSADFTTTDETYVINVRTSDDATFATGVTTLETKTVTAAQLAAGQRVLVSINVDSQAKRYLELQYVLGGTTPSVTVSAFLVPRDYVDQYTAYASSILIG